MAFTGSAVVKQVADNIVRITGLALPAGQSGTIALHGGAGVVDRLGAAAAFAILAKHYINTDTDTVIDGDLGYITAPAADPTVSGDTHVNDAAYLAAVADLHTAVTALQALAATFTFAPGAINLAADTTHGSVGIFTPGVYDITGAMSVNSSSLTLNGRGLYVFRSTGALTVNDTVLCAGGADPNDVWWIPGAGSVINASLDFVGNIAMLAQLALTISQGVTWNGRALGSLPGGLGSNITTEFDTVATALSVPAGLGDTVFLPAAFRPASTAFDGSTVTLQDAVRCSTLDAQVIPSSNATPISVVKTGSGAADFLITLTNTGGGDSSLQEITVRTND